MPGDHVLRYIIELEPADQASEYEKMHLIYENKEYWELCRVGYGGMWPTIIWKGPWWDGTAPRFVLTPVHHQPLSHDEMLDQVIHVHGEEKVIMCCTTKTHAFEKLIPPALHMQGAWFEGFGYHFAVADADMKKDTNNNIEVIARLTETLYKKYGHCH